MNIFLYENLPTYPQITHHLPTEIEEESMRIIKSELSQNKIELNPQNEKVILRCIHTSADFDYAKNLVFSENAVEKLSNLLKMQNPVIVTDTNMALSGISNPFCKKYGIEKACFMADSDIAELSKKSGLTRAVCSIDKASQIYKNRPVIFAIGNAPTALVRIRQLYDVGIFTPSFVIAAPVGFVNVVQAKNLILESNLDFIVAKGRKGGSPIAATILNAVLYS